MSQRSNMFALIESRFDGATKEQITATAEALASKIILTLSQSLGEDAALSIVNMLLLSAKMGVAGDRMIGKEERLLLNDVFSDYITDMAPVYEIVSKKITDSDYEMMTTIPKLGNEIAMSFLNFILCFAYIDGKFEDEVAERLDGIFGITLLMEFIESGLEEVPSVPSKIEISDFEKEIIKYFAKCDDKMIPLDTICKHFNGRTKTEIKSVLDGMCEKGILGGGDRFFNCLYYLSDDIEVDFEDENEPTDTLSKEDLLEMSIYDVFYEVDMELTVSSLMSKLRQKGVTTTREEVVNILERLCDEGAFFKATMPRSGLVYAMNN